MTAIVRAVSQSESSNNRGLLVLDEPTASMGVRERGRVVALLAKLRAQGFSLLYVSHDIPQVFALADRICLLRCGRVEQIVTRNETSVSKLVAAISGVNSDA